MTEFKIGDRVRVLPDATFGDGSAVKDDLIGKTGVIAERSPYQMDGEQTVKFDHTLEDAAYFVNSTGLELVNENFIAIYHSPNGRWIVREHSSRSSAEAEIAALKNVDPDYKATLAKVVL